VGYNPQLDYNICCVTISTLDVVNHPGFVFLLPLVRGMNKAGPDGGPNGVGGLEVDRHSRLQPCGPYG